MQHQDFDAGEGQLVVVYLPDDTGSELDPMVIFGEVADDAKARSADGQRLLSVSALPLRHSALFMGREGSGFESKGAVVAVYARSEALPGRSA